MNKKISVLLVDDDEDDQEFFQEVLQAVEPPVYFLSAKDGQEAIAVLSASQVRPDVIFLDLNMPRMNGKECLRCIKSNQNLKQIPVVIYTTSTAPDDVAETRREGAIGFITKPTDVQKMKTMLASIIGSIPHGLVSVVKQYSQTSMT